MLSAFKAQPIHEFKPRDKAKIESILSYGDRIFVGLNSGALRVYRINEEANQAGDVEDEVPPSPTRAKPVELKIEYEKFSKKPIQQLALIKEANLLLSLSDSYVSFHDLQEYELVERLERTKGASCFAVTSYVVNDPEANVNDLVSRLAVAVKRKILLWTWQDTELAAEVKEISLEASIKSVNWVGGTNLIAGMDPGFCAVDIVTEEICAISKQASRTTNDSNPGELAGVRFGAVSSSGMGYMGMGSWVPKPMVTGLPREQVLLAKDVNTLFTDTKGKALEKRQVPWAFAPEAIGYSYPYLLALQPPEKGALQIRNPDTLSLLQTLAVPGATILHVPQPNISLAHLGKGFLVASDRTIWRMNAVSYDTQLYKLLELGRFDEAISLLNLLEDTLIDDKAGRIREIKTLKATALFQDQKYRPALDLFIDAETSPERVIALYPKVIAGDLSRVTDDAEEQEPNGVEEPDEKAEVNRTVQRTPTKGMLGILNRQRRADSDAASVKSPFGGDMDNMSVRGKSTTKATDKPLESDDLRVAVQALFSFLAQARKNLQKYLDPDGLLKEDPPTFDVETGKPAFANLLPQGILERDRMGVDWAAELLRTARIIDTTLFRAYVHTNPSLAGSLFRIDNFCEPQVVQAALYERERYSDLIDFLHGKKLHRQALELLAQFGKGEADGKVPPGMIGPERTVGYLKQLPPELVEVILEFAAWPIKTNPSVGMDIFLADTYNAERLPRERVLVFLAAHGRTFEIQYLEHIIIELGESEPDFHQHLVNLYLAELKHKDDGNGHKDEQNGDREATQHKLEAFLRKSRVYNKGRTFEQLPTTDPIFYETRAIVLSAMGCHKQALAIYVFQIQDYAKAEEYCNRIFLDEAANPNQQDCVLDLATRHPSPSMRVRPDPFEPSFSEDQSLASASSGAESSKDNIFAILLGLYLRPPPDETTRWPQALALLSKHGARLPTSSTLDLMPDHLAVAELQRYFLGRIRSATATLREASMVRQLEGVRQAAAERTLLLGDALAGEASSHKPMGRNRRVRIGDDELCRVCQKHFQAGRAVRVFPDDEVVHYSCLTASGTRRGGGSSSGNRTRESAFRSGGGLGALRQSSG